MAYSALPPPISTTASPLSQPHTSSITTTAAPPNQNHPSKPKTPSIRYRLSKICQQGQPHLARQLFDTLPRPNTVLWNTIIIGFICNNLPNEALLFYAQMKCLSPHTKCDSYTYSSTLKACAETRNLRLGKAVHCHFIRCQHHPSRIVYNSLLNMYSTSLTATDSETASFTNFDYSKFDLVRRVFDTMRKRNVVSWNTLISWYVKTDRFREAIRLFRMMMKIGLQPSPVSFVNVFPAVFSTGHYNLANALYGMVFKLGSDFAKDLFVVSSAIFMYAELGRLDFARRIFDCCVERNTEVWNTMIGAYVQNNCHDEGIELFLQAMESEQTVLDDVTFLSALTAASQLQCLNFAQQLHAHTIKTLIAAPTIIQNAVIVMYSRCNSIEASFIVFHKMLERDVVSWNTMVTAFVQNGLDDEGLMLVYEMQRQGFAIDSVTVTALLSAASNLRNQDIGKQSHAYLIRHGIQFEGMDSYLIGMYAKSGLIRTSQRLFQKSCIPETDQATWNAMVAGYTQNGMIDEAFSVFRQMLENNVIPNSVTLASLLPACSTLGNINLGKQLHNFSIRQSLDQNVFVGTALVDMYSKSGAVVYAENVFTKAAEKNSVTFTSMILGYGQHGMGERAVSLFKSMNKFGIEPDAITFVAVLSACSYAGLVDEGLQIFESMEKQYNIRPSTQHYCCVADMLGRIGKVAEAYKFVTELGDEGNTFEIWGSLLGACRMHGRFELGEIVAKKLLEMDTGDTIGNSLSGYRVLLSNIHAEEGNWKNADQMRKEMREKGLKKEVGCSWIDIAGSVNCFASRDKRHTQVDEIYEMLDELAVKMKDSGYRPPLSSLIDGTTGSDV